MFQAFKLGFAAGLGVLAAGFTGLILWGLYDVVTGIIASIKLAWQLRKGSKEPPAPRGSP